MQNVDNVDNLVDYFILPINSMHILIHQMWITLGLTCGCVFPTKTSNLPMQIFEKNQVLFVKNSFSDYSIKNYPFTAFIFETKEFTNLHFNRIIYI